jgi:hypothetical protein
MVGLDAEMQDAKTIVARGAERCANYIEKPFAPEGRNASGCPHRDMGRTLAIVRHAPAMWNGTPSLARLPAGALPPATPCPHRE